MFNYCTKIVKKNDTEQTIPHILWQKKTKKSRLKDFKKPGEIKKEELFK